MKFSFELSMRDMVFMNYAVPAARLRGRIPQNLSLDRPDGFDPEKALVSLVAFRVTAVRWNSGLRLPLPGYCQINCRAYVKSEGEPGVYFLAMRLSSLMAIVGATVIGVPVQYRRVNVGLADIRSSKGNRRHDANEISFPPHYAGRKLIQISSKDLSADLSSGGEVDRSSLFFTERPLGYISGRAGLVGVTAVHDPLLAFKASIESLRAPILREFGLADEQETAPESIYYVPETTLRSNVNRPAREVDAGTGAQRPGRQRRGPMKRGE